MMIKLVDNQSDHAGVFLYSLTSIDRNTMLIILVNSPYYFKYALNLLLRNFL